MNEKRTLQSRLITSGMTAGAGFCLGTTVLSVSVGSWDDPYSAMVRFGTGLLLGFGGLLVGLVLTKRVAVGCLSFGIVVALVSLIGGFIGRQQAQPSFSSEPVRVGKQHVSDSSEIVFPGMPSLKRHSDTRYGISIGFPSTWEADTPLRNEILRSRGEIRGIAGICAVRVSAVDNLHLVTPDEFFSQTDEDAFIKLTSIGMPDIRVHLFDMAYLADRPSRRIIYSGTDSGIRTGTVIYQALDGDRIFTVLCVSEAASFYQVYNDFEMIISSFSFGP